MNLPNTLIEELKGYLQQRVDMGDLEAKILLTQLKQMGSSPDTVQGQLMYSLSPEEGSLGC